MRVNTLSTSLVLIIAATWLATTAVSAPAAWVQEAKLIAGDGGNETGLYGYAAAIEGSMAMVGGYDASNKTYFSTYNGSAWSEKQILTSSDGLEGRFGSAIAMEGNTALIGAPKQDTEWGAVYVFNYNGTNWTETQKISNTIGIGAFGKCISLQGTTALIGAETQYSKKGAAYIYDYDGTTWTQTAELMSTPAITSACFGSAVSLDGNTAVIGARNESSGQGAAYIFEDAGSGWTQTAKLLASDGIAGDSFGFTGSVAISGDTVAVGAYRHGTGGTVYIYERDSNGDDVDDWGQVAEIEPDDAHSGDWFGRTVLLDGGTLFVGAPQYNNSSGTGAVYVFSNLGGSWTQMTKLTADDAGAGDCFGWGLGWDGARLISGAPYDDDNNTDAGAAYVFLGDISTPEPGDANKDGSVNAADAAILADNWLESGASWSMGDFNGDHIVDDRDATMMAANWDGSLAASAPEPSTIALLCAGLAMLALRRRR